MKRFLCQIVFLFMLCYAAPAHALTSGSTATGSISAGGTSPQSFSGTAGQGIVLYANAGYTVVINVYKPDGTLWTSAWNRINATLPSTGAYSVVLSGLYGTDSGTYTVAYVRGSDSVSNGSLTSGQTSNTTLSTNGVNSYQFTGTAGQGINLYANATYTAGIYVYNPDGSPWTSNWNRVSGTLGYTGTYTVVLAGLYSTDNGPYSLAYVKGGSGVSSGTLASGTTYNSNLSANDLQSFQFTGTAGQGVNLYAVLASGTYYNNIYLYNPDGSPWTSGGGRVSGTLPTTGTYTAVFAGGYATDSGPYQFNYVEGANNVSDGTLINSSTRTSNLALNGLISYQFSGVGGNTLTVATTGDASNPYRSFSVYDPTGAYWTGFTNSTTQTLPAGKTGVYTAVQYGGYPTEYGQSTVLFQTPPAPVSASTASEVPTNGCSSPSADSASSANSSPNTMSGLGDGPGSGTGSGPTPTAGNPINADVGFKAQNATDYNVGGLNFSRIYRSDSTWTSNTIGNLWRTNYARTLTVSSSSASVTDWTGATTQFTSSGGLWVPADPNTTAMFFTSGSNYLYTLPDNTVETYSSASKLTRIAYLGGGALNLSYNSSGLLSTIANENLRQMTLTYGSAGKVATLVTPDGTYAYSYDASGRLGKVTKPNTKFTQYFYENATYTNALTGIQDESGIRYASFGYDASGKGILTQHANLADKYTINYASASAGATTITNPLGKNTTYNFINIGGVRKIAQVDGAASTNCVASNRNYNYDIKSGWLIGKTDWEGNTTRYQYDARGNITQIIEGSNTPQQVITNLTYSSALNLPLTVSEPGKTTTTAYDTYGRVTSVTVTDTATAETRTTTYTYYSNTTVSGNLVLGRLHTVDGPRTDVSDITTYTYDANFNLTKITNALSQDTQILTRDTAGRPTKIQDPNGINTALTYNSSGLLGTLVYASGTGLAATTSYIYNPNNDLTQVTLPNGVITKYSYDSNQNLTGITDGLNNTITYTLNAAGKVTQEQYKTSAAVLKYTHKQVFDELARLIQDVGASNQISFTSYDKNSNVNRYKDQLANVTLYAYDPLIRFISSTNALNGVTQLQYTSLSDLKSVTDPRTNTTAYTYNAFGNVTSETSPDRGTIQYSSYDGAGNLKSSTDARGIVTNYAYDALNRMTSIAYPSSITQNATLTYDSASGIGCGTAGIGHLCFTSDTGRTAYQYNALGQLTYTSESRGAVNFTTTYAYDGAGFLTGITLPSGRTIAYTSTANGRVGSVVAKVNGSNVTLASSIVYLPFGPLTTMTYGNGKTFTGTYNQDYNPTNFTVSSIYSNTITFDSASNIIQMSSGTYGYDALLRMSSESGTLYTYDATSNRTAKGATSITVPSTSNKISAVGANALTYDSSGNILTYNGSAYTWNAANQLSFVSASGSTVGTYTYNYLNQRTKKVAGATTTFYVYGLNGQLYGEYTSAGALVREYVYLNGNPLAQVNAGSPETATWLHTDQLGTPRFGTNSSGTQVWAWNSDAFGNGTPTGSVTVNLRLPGQYYDSESGLFNNWNRYYNSTLGRYITSDPIGLAGGLNTFNYVGQSPLMHADPQGLGPEVLLCGLFAPECQAIEIAAAEACALDKKDCVRILAEAAAKVAQIAKNVANSASAVLNPVSPVVTGEMCTANNPTGTAEQGSLSAPDTGSAVDDRSGAANPPPPENEEDRCRRVVSECQDMCSAQYAAGGLGAGTTAASNIRVCIRQCANNQGCYSY